MSIAASLIVKFGRGADSSALVVMEFDETMNLDAAGKVKTSFSPGDEIFFLIHHEASLRADQVLATSGMVVYQGLVSRDKTEQKLFVEKADTHELSHIPSGGIAVSWYGNEGTSLKKSTARAVEISGGVMPAVADVSYSAEFHLYKLLTPAIELTADESWPITIVAYVVPS